MALAITNATVPVRGLRQLGGDVQPVDVREEAEPQHLADQQRRPQELEPARRPGRRVSDAPPAGTG